MQSNKAASMSILGNILSRVFGHPASAAPPATMPPAGGATQPTMTPGGASPATAAPGAATAYSATENNFAKADRAPVDVNRVMTDLAAKSGHPSNWKVSIVDLMTLLGLDSSLTARKQLADELGFTGDKNDSASMNIWLHKQVMQKLADNGGVVPADLH